MREVSANDWTGLLQILEATATDLKDPSTTNSRINDLAAGTVCV